MDGRGYAACGAYRINMHLSLEQECEIYRRALLCRRFEERAYRELEQKRITVPVYLSAGQELTPATLAVLYESCGASPHVFIQHRGHSIYLSFGGCPRALARELQSMDDGCAGGMGGSASIHFPDKQIYGHDGLMGSHVPIAVGFAFERREPTVCFVGDAAAEEDYSLTAIGWASTKMLPICFVVEDNNLSILTEKRVRRNWELDDVAAAMKLRHACRFRDESPQHIASHFPISIWEPALLNVFTTRRFWHAGAGQDPMVFNDPLAPLGAELTQRAGPEWMNETSRAVDGVIEWAWS